MYGRPTEVTEDVDRHEVLVASRRSATRTWLPSGPAGTSARRPRSSPSSTRSSAAPAEPGVYRNVSGTAALAWGLIAASARSGLPLFYASYPITPASELLHELSRHKNFGVRTIQAEDEIAAANLALGAAFGGALGVTGTSGPGMDLKSETIGLAVDARAADGDRGRPACRPLDRHADEERGGRPADGACTAATASRRSRSSPPYTPAQCFDAAIEAAASP